MTPTEAASVLAIVASLDGRGTLTSPEAIRAWQMVLDDVPVQACRDAVVRHYRTSTQRIMPADLRRMVAEQAGLLCPPEAQAWIAAVRVASAEGVGRRGLHPAVEQAYAAMGGAAGRLTSSDTTVRAQFRDTYAQAVRAHDSPVLSGEGGGMGLALTGAPRAAQAISA